MNKYNLALEWRPTSKELNSYVYALNDFKKSISNKYLIKIISIAWFKPWKFIIETDLSNSEILLEIYNCMIDFGLYQWFSLTPRLDNNKKRRI